MKDSNKMQGELSGEVEPISGITAEKENGGNATEGITSPWFTTKVETKSAKNVKIENTDEGIMISGDNLTDLIVKGNNREEQTELNINTDKNKILIKPSEDQTKMVAYIDTDGDGTFETIIGETIAEKIPENNNNIEDNQTEKNQPKEIKKIKTGDTIIFFVILLIVSVSGIIVISKFKHKNNK